jgi:hypothetical protein
VRLGSEVIEQQARFARRHGNIKIVGHEQKDIHVVRLGLRVPKDPSTIIRATYPVPRAME